MKDKERKIITVFSAHWDILRAFCGKLQGCDKQQEASLISHIWLFNILDSVTSIANIRFNILKWIPILSYTFLQCLARALKSNTSWNLIFTQNQYNFMCKSFYFARTGQENVFGTDFPPLLILIGSQWQNLSNSSKLHYIMDSYLTI